MRNTLKSHIIFKVSVNIFCVTKMFTLFTVDKIVHLCSLLHLKFNEEHHEITHNIQGECYYFLFDYNVHFIHFGQNVHLCSLLHLEINEEHLTFTHNIQNIQNGINTFILYWDLILNFLPGSLKWNTPFLHCIVNR